MFLLIFAITAQFESPIIGPDSRERAAGSVIFVSEPAPGTLREHVDLIEKNSFYDDSGRLVFDQLLFRDWHSGDGMHHLRAWRMIKPSSDSRQSIQSPPMLPRYSHAHGLWVVEWKDGDVWRRITATRFASRGRSTTLN